MKREVKFELNRHRDRFHVLTSRDANKFTENGYLEKMLYFYFWFGTIYSGYLKSIQ